MKRVFAVLLPLALCATSAFAWVESANFVRWNSIVGVITAPGVDNPVAGIRAGAGPWSVGNGHARVNLSNGNTFFDVDGLVLNGCNSGGTPGPVTAVTGTLVCNAGARTAAVLDTTSVPLNTQGRSVLRPDLRRPNVVREPTLSDPQWGPSRCGRALDRNSGRTPYRRLAFGKQH